MLIGTTGLRVGLAVVVVGLATGMAPVPEDATLRERVLALNQVTGEDTVRGEIRLLKDDPAGTKKLLPVAIKMAKEKKPPLSYNAAYILARAAQLLKDQDSAVPLYRACIDQANLVKSPMRLYESYEGIVASYYVAGKYDDCLKALQEFLELPEEKVADPANDDETPKYNATLKRAQQLMRRELVQVLARQGKVDEAHKVVDNMLKQDPDDVDALELRAGVQREAGQYAEAAKTYDEMVRKLKEIIDEVNKKPGLKKEAKEAFTKRFNADVRDYRYIQSSLYIDANLVDKAVEVLKDLLKEDPDNPSYNNDLGYVWADHDQNLAESEKMIRKAIDEDRKKQAKDNPELKPDQIKANGSYLDSLGWVLFKQKKYKEALPPLEDAVKADDGQSIEIFDHLAEVHMALGEKAAAVAAWEKGVAAWEKNVQEGRTSKREQLKKVEVEKKIKANK